MKETILELTAEEARTYFLHPERFCAIDLLKYFDFLPLLEQLNAKLQGKKLCDIQDTKKPNDCENVNYKFLTNKDGNLAWRPLQIINPAIYICLVNRIIEHWGEIVNRFHDFQKNPNIQCYSIPLVTPHRDSQMKIDTSVHIRNWWEEIEQQSILLALKFNCVLITDITDCYGSIYTHSIAWALHDKDVARANRTIKPPTIIGCIIDDIIQAMSYRQTNGIPQGSVLMDFIAEMVLGYADMELSNKIQNNHITFEYQILRYRDDYRIFAQTQENAVILAKLLSETLSELNLKLNTQKTLISNDIIREVIKPDKLYWNEISHEGTSLQKQLLRIYSLSEKYPNSGSLSTALSKFIDKITPLEVLDEDTHPLISILVNLAYNNPRTYSAVVVCLGKLLSIESDSSKVENIYQLIQTKFQNKPNVGYWKVWFQRLTIKTDREREKDSDEKLCQIAANNTTVQLWDVSWLKDEYRQVFDSGSIFSEEKYNSTPIIPDKTEVQLFGRY